MKREHILRCVGLTPIVASAIALSSCGEKEETINTNSDDKVLRITAIPDKKVSDQSIKYKALSDYLATELGVKVEYVNSQDYSASVNRFANNEVQLVWFGGLTGVQARARVEGSRAIVQGVVDPEYKSYFIAHESTGLERSDQFPQGITDLTFTFGSKKSTSGRLMPTWFIQKETGKTPEEFFSKPIQFTGKASHAGTANAVNEGSVQAGVLSYKTYDSMIKSGEIDPNKAKIIWVTPGYADYNFTAHPSLDETFGAGFIDKLQTALISCKDKEVLAVLKREEGLIEAKNDDFASIVTIAKELGFFKE
ncbi:MAG: putative selenate ABC transporter substrate-binding protein [Akkermansiaceae bacterium]|nr:putative selenate ABC transporter substrate-binding protein [Akkermansiaceae bacterium]